MGSSFFYCFRYYRLSRIDHILIYLIECKYTKKEKAEMWLSGV